MEHVGEIEKRLWSVAVSLLRELETQMRDIQDIFVKASTRDRFKQTIYDFLYDDRTGLPVEAYNDNDLSSKTDSLFKFFERRAANQDISNISL